MLGRSAETKSVGGWCVAWSKPAPFKNRRVRHPEIQGHSFGRCGRGRHPPVIRAVEQIELPSTRLPATCIILYLLRTSIPSIPLGLSTAYNKSVIDKLGDCNIILLLY